MSSVTLQAPYRRTTVGIVSAILVIAFEAMGVGTAMPEVVADLDGDRWYAWSFTAYLAASLWAMVWAGEDCDRRGPGRPMLAGLGAFVVGLVLAGLAQNMATFVAGRAVQGLGGGAIIVAIYVLVARVYPEEMRPKVFSAMAAAWVLPSIVGPLLAGVVAENLTWRLVFLAVPLLVAPSVWLLLPRLRAADAAGPAGEGRPGRTRLALMTAVGVALLQYGGQELGWVGLLAGAAALALLVPSVPRLLPPGTLRLGRGLPTTVALRGLLAGGFFGAEAFLPLMLNSERGLSLALGGLALTGAAIGWSVGSWFQGHSDLEIARWLLVRRGAVLTVVGVALVASTVSDAVPPAVAGIGWLVGGFGMGVAMPSISIVLFELSPVEDQGANSAALQVCDALASTFFIGVGGVIFAAGHTTAGEDADVFLAVFAVMTAVLVVAVFAAGRMAVRHPAPVPVGAARPNEETSGAAERACH